MHLLEMRLFGFRVTDCALDRLIVETKSADAASLGLKQRIHSTARRTFHTLGFTPIARTRMPVAATVYSRGEMRISVSGFGIWPRARSGSSTVSAATRMSASVFLKASSIQPSGCS